MSRPLFSLRSSIWLMADEQSLAGPGRIELLEHIGRTGSIRQAARAMGMSYRAAWDAVDMMNQRYGAPLVARAVGGRGGGGALLTDEGKRLIEAFHEIEDEHRRCIENLNRRAAALSGEPR